jgi:hypothetical protein
MKKPWFLLCIGLLIISCGPRLIYTHLDRLIPKYANDYLPLNGQQRDRLDERLNAHLAWHCRTQLVRYATFFDRLRIDVSDPNRPVTPARVGEYDEIIKNAWNDLLHQTGPDIARILSTAEDAQIAALSDNLAEKNEEIAKKYIHISPESQDRLRQKEMRKRLHRWISRLTPEQEALVAAWSAAYEPMAEDRLAFRKMVQKRFLQLLRQRSRNGFEAAFTDLLTHFRELRTPAYQRKLDINREKTLELLVELERSLTPSQRDHLLDRFRSYSKIFMELSCDPEGSAIGSGGGT